MSRRWVLVVAALAGCGDAASEPDPDARVWPAPDAISCSVTSPPDQPFNPDAPEVVFETSLPSLPDLGEELVRSMFVDGDALVVFTDQQVHRLTFDGMISSSTEVAPDGGWIGEVVRASGRYAASFTPTSGGRQLCVLDAAGVIDPLACAAIGAFSALVAGAGFETIDRVDGQVERRSYDTDATLVSTSVEAATDPPAGVIFDAVKTTDGVTYLASYDPRGESCIGPHARVIAADGAHHARDLLLPDTAVIALPEPLPIAADELGVSYVVVAGCLVDGCGGEAETTTMLTTFHDGQVALERVPLAMSFPAAVWRDAGRTVVVDRRVECDDKGMGCSATAELTQIAADGTVELSRLRSTSALEHILPIVGITIAPNDYLIAFRGRNLVRIRVP